VSNNSRANGAFVMFLRGRCGVWTKSDSVTDFDELQFEPLPKR